MGGAVDGRGGGGERKSVLRHGMEGRCRGEIAAVMRGREMRCGGCAVSDCME
jgi:hypothetical protein